VLASGQINPREPEAPFHQVLFVRLIPFPRQCGPGPAAQNKGWFYSVLGPVDGLLHVRVASQAERNDVAVRLFTEMAARHGVPVASAEFTFELESGLYPPLSWMLTVSQKRDIERAWQRILGGELESNPLAVIDQLFDRV
jgi:hypothetical protein